MKKILDFLIIFLLAFLIVSLFTKNDDKKELSGQVSITSKSSSYSIPASVEFQVNNQTATGITFNTCQDISIKSSAGVVDMTGSTVCQDMVLTSGSSAIINYSDYFEKFQTPGEYYVEAHINETELLSRFEVDTRGSISKIFIFFVYQPILNLMDWLIAITGYSLGWSIILITFIVRIILVWPQHKMMLSQKKLQAIQPKIKKIQEQYKGNQQKIGVELMALYKKEKVNPMGSCGFLFIQMPILFVLYHVILEIKDPANSYYLYNFLQNFDIEKIHSNFYGMELFATGMNLPMQGALLAIAVGLVQFIQIKLSLSYNKKTGKGAVLEKKKGANSYSSLMPDPEMMNKFMLYGMPAMVTMFTFTFFAGLGLYWGISTVFMIFQQLVVNKILTKNKK